MQRKLSYKGDVTCQLGSGTLRCIVVSSLTESIQGLQKHAGLSEDEGMLFPFKPPRYAEFHMGTVSFPIDIIFVTGDKVAKIVPNVQPGTKGYWGSNNTSMVLEVAGGWAEKNGVTPGSTVHLNPYENEKDSAMSIDPLRSLTEAQVNAELRRLGRLGRISDFSRIAALSERDQKIVIAKTLIANQDLLSGYSKSPGLYRIILGRMISEAGRTPTHVVEVSTTAPESVKQILERIQENGSTGHSFSIVEGDGVVTDNGKPVNLGGWDGDGNDSITDIKVKELKGAQQLILMLTPDMLEQLQNMQQPSVPPRMSGAFDRLSRLLEDDADSAKLANAWMQISSNMDFWQKDALVRSLVEAGFDRAIGLLKVAQEDGKVTQSPGALVHNSPETQFMDNAIPADQPGLSDSTDVANWGSEIGYDQGAPGVDDGNGPGYRPGSLKLASGGIHPGDRVKVTDDADGLSSDDEGVALEVQEGMILVRFDGDEQLPRWVSDELLTQTKSKEDILKDNDEQGGKGLQGLGAG